MEQGAQEAEVPKVRQRVVMHLEVSGSTTLPISDAECKEMEAQMREEEEADGLTVHECYVRLVPEVEGPKQV